jgi:Ala-tRNA(Pro) deacylase
VDLKIKMKMTVRIEKVNNLNNFGPVQQALFALFDTRSIPHETWEHPPIFTVQEGEELGLHEYIPGQGGKSLLLKNKVDELWLVVACDSTRVDLKGLSDRLETKRFSFASPETMFETMQVTPGSATPFALMHDKDHKIKVVIDKQFLESEYCVFHPMENRWSTVIRVTDLLLFLEYLGYTPRIMDIA